METLNSKMDTRIVQVQGRNVTTAVEPMPEELKFPLETTEDLEAAEAILANAAVFASAVS